MGPINHSANSIVAKEVKTKVAAVSPPLSLATISLKNLFRPGRGGSPPHFAGRQSHLEEIEGIKEILLAEQAPSQDLILIGPRGNGKTVLLDQFRQKLGVTGEIDVLVISADEVGDNVGNAINRIASKSWLEEKFPGAKSAQFGTRGTHISFDFSANASASFRECLAARAEERQFALLIDEAHTLDKGVGKTILNAFQRVQTDEKRPVLLVLAGTPGLTRHLRSMNATFFDRSKKLRVGLLAEQSATELLTVPFAAHGITFDERALTAVISDSFRYPYFLQLWGEGLSRILSKSGEKLITMAVVEEAANYVCEVRNDYYGGRREELSEQLGQATLAARTLYLDPNGEINSRPKSFEELRVVMPQGTDAKETINALEDKGIIWQERDNKYVPGIPSLFDYLEKNIKREPSPPGLEP